MVFYNQWNKTLHRGIHRKVFSANHSDSIDNSYMCKLDRKSIIIQYYIITFMPILSMVHFYYFSHLQLVHKVLQNVLGV